MKHFPRRDADDPTMGGFTGSDPAKPLRADATDGEMIARHNEHVRTRRLKGMDQLHSGIAASVAVAREFAKACVLDGRLRERALITSELQAATRAESEAKLAAPEAENATLRLSRCGRTKFGIARGSDRAYATLTRDEACAFMRVLEAGEGKIDEWGLQELDATRATQPETTNDR